MCLQTHQKHPALRSVTGIRPGPRADVLASKNPRGAVGELGSECRTGFFPTDILSERIIPAIWRYTQMVWSDLFEIIKGRVDLRDWKAPQG